MDELMEIFEIIDCLDADKNIRDCYKEILLFEFNSKDTVNYNYRKEYERLIDKFMGDL